MSEPTSLQQGRQPSPGLSVNLSSNNPFRNRAASPISIEAAFASPTTTSTTATSPFDDPSTRQRPASRNPFLDKSDQPMRSPELSPNKAEHKSLSAEDIFDSLTLDDNMPNDKLAPALAAQRRPPSDKPPARPMEPRSSATSHKPTKSQEEALRARKPPPGPRPAASSRSPQRKPPPRARRNSDSSVMDFNAQPITPEELKMIEAKRLRDRQHREKAPREPREPREAREGREARDKDKDRADGKGRSKSGRPGRRLDIIDQLDATSIYGTGLFHHDGPFDALNPHRNRQSSRRAPMQAFPKDSLNNSLGGAGPLNRNPDHKTFMGNGTDEAFLDYAGGSRPKNSEPAIFDPISRGSLVHGDESYGLGTSTFLEGAPAARSAIVRRQVEQQQEITEGGIQRKKSLAQRIRSINNRGPRDFAPSGRMTNPDATASRRLDDSTPLASTAGTESNPFFAEFSKGEDSITVKTRDRTKSPVSPPMHTRPGSGPVLERRATADAVSTLEEAPPAKPSGILGRMKSLKGGRRSKNSDTNAQSVAPGMAL